MSKLRNFNVIILLVSLMLVSCELCSYSKSSLIGDKKPGKCYSNGKFGNAGILVGSDWVLWFNRQGQYANILRDFNADIVLLDGMYYEIECPRFEQVTADAEHTMRQLNAFNEFSEIIKRLRRRENEI